MIAKGVSPRDSVQMDQDWKGAWRLGGEAEACAGYRVGALGGTWALHAKGGFEEGAEGSVMEAGLLLLHEC